MKAKADPKPEGTFRIRPRSPIRAKVTESVHHRIASHHRPISRQVNRQQIIVPGSATGCAGNRADLSFRVSALRLDVKEQMKAYCINLDRRPDRLAYMTAEFARVGIPFERISAVDGKDPEVMEAAKRLPVFQNGSRIDPGAHACFESHRAIWRRLVDSGDAWAMVFEDDVVLAPDTASYLSEAWIPEDADIVRLETYIVPVELKKRSRPAGGRKLHELRSRHFGTGAYVISARTAKRLLADTQAMGLPVDHALFDPISPLWKGLIVYQMVPAPAIQGDRHQDKSQDAEWQQTSISKRFENEVTPAAQRNTLIHRLRKKWHIRQRIRQHIRGYLHGTYRATVPHG